MSIDEPPNDDELPKILPDSMNSYYPLWMGRLRNQPTYFEEQTYDALIEELTGHDFLVGEVVGEQTMRGRKISIYFRTTDQKLAYISFGGTHYRAEVLVENCEAMQANEQSTLMKRRDELKYVSAELAPQAKELFDDLPPTPPPVEEEEEDLSRKQAPKSVIDNFRWLFRNPFRRRDSGGKD